jgi:hypothetical protein
MKNLPDKIYILQHEDYSDRRILNAFTEKESNTDVEYIRKNAFIKKMQDWLKDRAELYVVETSLFSYYDYKKAIEDFKEYTEE